MCVKVKCDIVVNIFFKDVVKFRQDRMGLNRFFPLMNEIII